MRAEEEESLSWVAMRQEINIESAGAATSVKSGCPEARSKAWEMVVWEFSHRSGSLVDTRQSTGTAK